MSVRTCRIRGCTGTHQRNLFCCLSHWYQLPKPMRDEIWSAYRQHGVISNEYLQAAENAEAFLEDREPLDADVFT